MPVPPTRLSVDCRVASVAVIVLLPVAKSTLSAPVVSATELPGVSPPSHSDAVSDPVENAVVPPLTVVFAVPPLVPVVWSQALKLSVAAPMAPGVVGTNRTSVVALAASSNALVALTVGNAVHVVPPLMV